jgi:hypothetical protein
VTERPTFISNDTQNAEQQAATDNYKLKMIDDIVDWMHHGPELDHFNKESVLTGL